MTDTEGWTPSIEPLPPLDEGPAKDPSAAYAAAKAAALAASPDDQPAAIEAALVALAGTEPTELKVEAELATLKRDTGATLRILRDTYRRLTTGTDAADERTSIATDLVRTAREHYDIYMSDGGEPYAVPKAGPRIPQLLRGGQISLRAQLARTYYQDEGRAAPQQALADALGTLDGFAQEQDPTELHRRVATIDAVTWLDMGDATGRAIRIDEHAWSTHPEAPIHYRRTPLTNPLPDPVPGGHLDELWEFLNVSEPDRPLILGWLVHALMATGPVPALALTGEQGVGKSTAARTITDLIDPSPAPIRKAPRDEHGWMVAASGGWVVCLDNLSKIQDWLSDALCRASTGDADVRRRLYTDASLTVIAFKLALILTGIDFGSVRGDLADRLLPIKLDIIDPKDRRQEADLRTAWKDAHPRILGALLTLVSGSKSALHSVELEEKPRMADFARTLASVDHVLGTNALARYLDSQARLAEDTLTGDPFMVALTNTITTPFDGTSSDLLALIEGDEEKRRPKGWPATARAVTQLLRRNAPVLRKAGWQASEDAGRNKAKVITWYIEPPSLERAGNKTRQTRQAQEGRPAHKNRRVIAKSDDPPDPPKTRQDPPMTRLSNAVQHASAGLAGQAGLVSQLPPLAERAHTLDPTQELSTRASELLPELRALTPTELSGRLAEALDAISAPPAFRTTATEEPLTALAALELLMLDMRDDATRGSISDYLNAARQASSN